MSTKPDEFQQRIDRLRDDIVAQGRRVLAMLEDAFDSVFNRDTEAARRVIALDDEVDRVDVEIEQAAVKLLTAACASSAGLSEHQLREVLTIVKVNNELERAGDAGVRAAEHVPELARAGADVPETFRVMTNSVMGILRDAITAYDRRDGELAVVVLKSENTVASFKEAIMKDLESQCAGGTVGIEAAQTMHALATDADRVADYCSNIAEQVLYATTGKIVRHTEAGWIEIERA